MLIVLTLSMQMLSADDRPKFFNFFIKKFWNLKVYSLMSNRGRSQNCQNLNFLHIFVALLQEGHFPKGIRLKSFQYEMRAIFTESLVHETLFNTVVYGSNETHIIMHNLKT